MRPYEYEILHKKKSVFPATPLPVLTGSFVWG